MKTEDIRNSFRLMNSGHSLSGNHLPIVVSKKSRGNWFLANKNEVLCS